ncbi:hypothetical protein PHMEG_00014078 [Phytophthora megakarya]|uniref:Peptidase A2 domain-containing protein n=1 Tax=Phytophthora megakarya TaxID=4795 RepID=A0A225W5S7_9STRA|nr:hypothetical protein PHMEG_00014078 [Phytophthora megakarya]
MAFELSIQEGALHWYRQLPRKTRLTWKPLSNAFIKYYCSKFNQCAKARQGTYFVNGGREAKDLVEHFLYTYDHRGFEERLCHAWINDIHDLEDMINDILKRRDRVSKRDSSVRRHSGQDGSRRRDSSRTEVSRSNYCRDDCRRDESPYRPIIILAEALSDLVTALNETSYDKEYELNEDSFGDGERRDDDDRYSNRGSEYDYAVEDERGHVAAANDHERRAVAKGTFARSYNRRPKGDDHFKNGRGFAHDNRNGRQQYGPCAACGDLTHSVHYCYKRCKICKQVHDAGKCEAFNELASLLRSKVDQNDLTPKLQSSPSTETGLVPIGLSRLAEPAVDADYLFAFAGEVKWPEDREMEIVEGNVGSLGENEVGEVDAREYDGGFGFEMGPNEAQRRSLVRTVKLLPGERLGWWSSQQYDNQKRMRAVVMGAIYNTRTRILLDTGANVSVISAAYAKRLRLREMSDHGRSLEVRGINTGVLKTRRRALVKIILG